jgi:hypothetical protein
MKGSDPSTWPKPSAEHTRVDADHGTVLVRTFSKLPPGILNHEGQGSRDPCPWPSGR